MAKDAQMMLRLPAAVLARVDRLCGSRGRGEWVRVAIEMRLAEIDEPDADAGSGPDLAARILADPAVEEKIMAEPRPWADVIAADVPSPPSLIIADDPWVPTPVRETSEDPSRAARDAKMQAWFARQAQQKK